MVGRSSPTPTSLNGSCFLVHARGSSLGCRCLITTRCIVIRVSPKILKIQVSTVEVARAKYMLPEKSFWILEKTLEKPFGGI